MLEPNLLERQIENVKVTLNPYKLQNLQNAIWVKTNYVNFFRSGAIESPKKAQEFLDCINKINQSKPLKILSCQVNNPHNEWELIQSQHRRLASLNEILEKGGKIAHLNIPMSPFFIDPANLPSEFMMKTIITLYRQLNLEGWMTYTRWLNDEIEGILKTFKPEAVDEYQLQARLEDFGIETHSLFINDVEKELKDTVIAMDQLELNQAVGTGSLFSLEKKAILLRERLKTELQTKCIILRDIVEGIIIIEAAHPELRSLKYKALMLACLVGPEVGIAETSALSAEQQFLLLQLLNQNLGVMTCVNCDTGLERTSLAFSLMLSMTEMSPQLPIDQLISMIINWNKTNSSAAEVLRRCVFANLVNLSLPFVKQADKKTGFPKRMQENQEFLSYLPAGRSYDSLMAQLSGY